MCSCLRETHVIRKHEEWARSPQKLVFCQAHTCRAAGAGAWFPYTLSRHQTSQMFEVGDSCHLWDNWPWQGDIIVESFWSSFCSAGPSGNRHLHSWCGSDQQRDEGSWPPNPCPPTGWVRAPGGSAIVVPKPGYADHTVLQEFDEILLNWLLN